MGREREVGDSTQGTSVILGDIGSQEESRTKVGCVLHTYNPSAWEGGLLVVRGQLDLYCKSQASQGCSVRPCFKNKQANVIKPGVTVYTWARSTWQAEAGRRRVSSLKPSLVPLWVQGQPRLHFKEGGREEIVKTTKKEISQNVTLIKL